MFSRLAVVLGLRGFARRDDLDDRATVLTLVARFTDELGSGLLVVLTPTLRARLGLSVTGVGWSLQALATAGAVVSPPAAAAIDLVPRRPLLVFGAAGWAVALGLAATAPNGVWLIVAFALAGAAYGPLTATADVVLVEGHPGGEERISSRVTLLDTAGALLAPTLVAGVVSVGADPRWLLLAVGAAAVAYAAALGGTAFPAPAARQVTAVAHALDGVRTVLRDRRARRWVAAVVVLELRDPLEAFEPVWLDGSVGASQVFVAVHTVVGLAASLLALVAIDRWLVAHDGDALLRAALVVTAVSYPLWLAVPGLGAKLALVVMREGAAAALWPLVNARALAAVPGRAGSVASVAALVGFVPVHVAAGAAADRFGLTRVLLAVHLVAVTALWRLVRADRRPTVR